MNKPPVWQYFSKPHPVFGGVLHEIWLFAILESKFI